MAIFERFTRRDPDDHDGNYGDHAVTLPEINQRVTIGVPGQPAVATRVDDETEQTIVLSLPTLPLTPGQVVYMTWEDLGRVMSYETKVEDIDLLSHHPSVHLSKDGRAVAMRERVPNELVNLDLPLNLRIVQSRRMRSGQTLNTETSELGAETIRFTTSAPLVPGDVAEGTIYLESGETVRMRVRIIRMDTIRDSWRQTCTVAIEDIHRTDKRRLVGLVNMASG